ncbi:dihydroorotate dehydrogenase (quinone) [Pseudoclavibacter endophyticus]|uniref:Dihydroorotate dehydrogenase (quinone) n=1 Tax=Pseudoclavibacter endophyticus TaxID=1778590 RepID=A0A6H9WQ26_9MICO|nr:quinone-dependent dihydroorotate dehydrogenase [Pseudoclavibacter endophyticus]KAB1650238.1 quinone-dependent dihydroorotate dehydrogenase [Pseudoclavibacter endophyticus]GGA55946.1 dihydroorotate dehydrogenase (quinone) [Pseudoclavibacter endophyticus]
MYRLRLYPLVFELVLRRLETERAHALGSVAIRMLGSAPLATIVRRFTAPHPSLRTEALGLTFPSPFGLAAGFDKDARDVDGLHALGFGHVEVGTVTPVPQPGNPRPRMYRLIDDRGLINRMGFNNLGAVQAASALRRRATGPATGGRIIVGVNIGKNKDTPADQAARDYVAAAQAVRDVADYLVVNVSSPNTPGLRGLQELDALEPILRATLDAAGGVPLLVKIAPDLSDDEIRRIAGLATNAGLAGVVATNTTVSREGLRASARVVEAYGAGGLSGGPLRERSLHVLRVLRDALPADRCLVSVGGVTSADDVLERLEAGANLVQGYTAFLYEGPLWAARINRALRRRGLPRTVSAA